MQINSARLFLGLGLILFSQNYNKTLKPSVISFHMIFFKKRISKMQTWLYHHPGFNLQCFSFVHIKTLPNASLCMQTFQDSSFSAYFLFLFTSMWAYVAVLTNLIQLLSCTFMIHNYALHILLPLLRNVSFLTYQCLSFEKLEFTIIFLSPCW